jgi:hypothetical protein
MQFRDEGFRDRFPKEQGLGKFNSMSIDFLRKLVARFNLV